MLKVEAISVDYGGVRALIDVSIESKKYKPVLDLSVLLNDIQIALPVFGLKGPPPLIPDSRLKKTLVQKVKDPATSLEYSVRVKTADAHPIRLLSNLAKTPVPVELDILIDSSKAPSGEIRVKEFAVEFFRRKAQMKYFNVKLKGTDEETLHGLIEVHYTDYLVKIYLDGTTREPTYRFESVPPLSQNDIISVLLFGRKTDENDPGQTGSVANTQAALADKAVGLASMYLLASTPIESVGYNSQSQTFTAKFRLTEGTSLNVGAGDSGVKEVGVNRHLGGPWYIYTFLKNPAERQDRSTAAFLQWVLRY